VELDEIDVTSRPVLRDFEQIDDARETRAACERRSDVVELDLVQRVDDDAARRQ
jgi:hypothetical protein